MVKMKFVDLFETNNFISAHLFRIMSQSLSEKLNF